MTSSLKKQVQNLKISKKKHQDFDPEDDPFTYAKGKSDSDSDSDSAPEVTSFGREHYQPVGKSQLRKSEKAKLDDKKYGGQVVSRASLADVSADDDDPFAPNEDDADEDPFAERSTGRDGKIMRKEDEDEEAGLSITESDRDDELSETEYVAGDVGADDEIDSDDAFGDGEEEAMKKKGFVFRGSGMSKRIASNNDSNENSAEENSQDDSEESNGSIDDDVDGEMDGSEDYDEDESHEEQDSDDQGEDDSENEDEDEMTARPNPKQLSIQPITDREKVKSLMSSDTAAIASSLSQAALADVRKGKAVQKQYQTFDRLLDTRIKLQKGLTSVNDQQLASVVTDEESLTALRKAEEAALRLYSTIESIRHSVLDVSNSSGNGQNTKRKRPTPVASSISAADLGARLETLEAQSLPHRKSVLDKWSAKTRAAAPSASSNASKFTQEQTQSKLSTVIDTYLLSEQSKLISQSTATSASDTPSTSTYDDTIFYQSLLRDLIASRSRANPNGITAQPSISDPLPTKLHASGNTRKRDTKASKGRKIRYTVHEKLENFMASEGRNSVGQWTDSATREFFGSLMGNQGQLDEADAEAGMDVDSAGEDADREGEALRLFRS